MQVRQGSQMILDEIDLLVIEIKIILQKRRITKHIKLKKAARINILPPFKILLSQF